VAILSWSATGCINVPTGTSGNIVIDLLEGDWHALAPLTGPATLEPINIVAGQQFTVILISGGNAVTWFPGILWPGGTAPALTATAGKRDVCTFKCISSGLFLGFVVGQNL